MFVIILILFSFLCLFSFFSLFWFEVVTELSTDKQLIIKLN